jgi:hypothetical protein
MAQALLHRRQHTIGPGGFGEDHPVGVQPDQGKRRGEQVMTLDNPQHLTAPPAQKPRHQQRRRRAVLGLRSRARHLMQRPAEEPAPRQRRVNDGGAEPDDPGAARRRGCLNPSNARPKLLDKPGLRIIHILAPERG